MPLSPATFIQAATPASDFWKIAVPAASGLIGVVIGGAIQAVTSYIVVSQQRRFRLADEEAERLRIAAKLDSERGYVRAVLARHLEGYARACAHAMWDNQGTESQDVTGIPDFPPWPEVAWELLGANEMMKARDVEVRADMQKESAHGAVWYGASYPAEARSYYADAASRIGLMAWNIARQMREESGVEPFVFPQGQANFGKALMDEVAELDEKERRSAEREASAAEQFEFL